MGKNKNKPMFRISVSTLSGVEMSFLVKRGYSFSYLGPLLWEKLRLGIVSRWDHTSYVLVCSGKKVVWSCKLMDYNVRDDVEILPSLVVVLRRPGE
jgi:hypothetical protein